MIKHATYRPYLGEDKQNGLIICIGCKNKWVLLCKNKWVQENLSSSIIFVEVYKMKAHIAE